jgi:hypothetical protein
MSVPSLETPHIVTPPPHWPHWSQKVRRYVVGTLVGIWNTIFILISLYLAWGWITISDVRSYCEQKGLNFEEVIEGIANPPGPSISSTKEGFKVTFPKDDAVLRRLRINLTTLTVQPPPTTAATSQPTHSEVAGFWFFQGNLFEFFAILSENVINTLFAFGVGYLVSMLIVGAHALRSKSPRGAFYVWLRPLLGGMAAATLFVLVLSGGKLIWAQVSHTNSTAIGVLGIAGAVWCEKFDTLLRRAVELKPHGKKTKLKRA